ncbi:MAG: hypothetical protein AAGA48_08785 [Myxococcota bacterium]
MFGLSILFLGGCLLPYDFSELPSASPTTACVEGTPECPCDDGIDNDENGQADCLDAGCATAVVCQPEDCEDGIDNNGDGATDCDDLACLYEDVCQAEICDDGVDNNQNGQIDCLDVEDCALHPNCCLQGTLTDTAAMIVDEGLNANEPTCGDLLGPDVSYAFTPSKSSTYIFETLGSTFDTVLSIREGCGGAELACDDNTFGAQSQITIALQAGVTYAVYVDAKSNTTFLGGSGVTLTVREAETTESDCHDDIDNDGNGVADCFDPECSTLPDCVELCDDGLDNTNDGLIDCLDPLCATDAVCCPTNTTSGVGTYNTATYGLNNFYAASCSITESPEATFAFTAPQTGIYVIDTFGSTFDTVLSVYDGCGGLEIDCNDDAASSLLSELTIALMEDESVLIVVEGYEDQTGVVTLNIE